MSFHKGGQRRTVESSCGWRCVGHPTEVNKKYLRHSRYCNECKHSKEIPEYNKEAGILNGWKGINNKNQKANELISYAIINGEQYNIHTKGTNMKEAMDEIYLTANLIAAEVKPEETPLTKSKKKRQKQKAKKEKEAELTLFK